MLSAIAIFAAAALAAQASPGSAAPTAPARAAVETPVLARSIERGETLVAADFTVAALAPATARSALPPREVDGQEATRRLSAGSPVRAADIAPPRLIRRGQAVTITLVTGSLRIATPGRALGDAARGDVVRVLNIATNRTLDAVAEGPGEARVSM